VIQIILWKTELPLFVFIGSAQSSSCKFLRISQYA
jgi:hypothetical protein